MSSRTLSRRRFTRSLAAAVGLPLLGSLRARADTTGPVRRLVVFYVPNGVLPTLFWPTATGALVLPPTLEPLAPWTSKMLVVRGLHNAVAESYAGTLQGFHATATASCLSGVAPKQGRGLDVAGGITLDQRAIEHVGRGRILPSLELSGSDFGRPDQCEPNYSCVYNNSLAWKDATTPLMPLSSPSEVFDRLFGTSSNPPAALRRRRRSILDAVANQAGRLRDELPWEERAAVESYLTTVRELEQRVADDRPLLVDGTLPPVNPPVDQDVRARLDSLVDLAATALRTDATRVVTFMVGPGQSNILHSHLGVKEGHHDLSHMPPNEEVSRQLALIDRWEVSVFARLLAKLDEVPEGDGTLLDHTLVLFTSEFGAGHSLTDIPTLVLGGGFGIRGGRALSFGSEPVQRLHLTLLRALGSTAMRFGRDGNAPLAL